MSSSLSLTLQHAVRLAEHQARQHTQATYGGGHLLYGLLDEDSGLHEMLSTLEKEVPRLRQWANFRIEHYPKSSKVEEAPKGDSDIELLFTEANRISVKTGSTEITPYHALEALCMPGVVFSAEQLMRFPIRSEEISSWQNGHQKAGDLGDQNGENIQGDFSSSNTQFKWDKTLSRFCDDLTQEAREEKLDPVIGRDRELQSMIKILGKRISPNVILVGEPGVGKTAIVGGLAQEIVLENIPENLKGVSLFELDVHGRLVAGAYKGEVEERLKKVLQAVKKYGKIILFIDEIHSLLDERASVGAGAINILKPELARGEITIIGATTHAEYRKYFEKDGAFERRFSKLEIEEPKEKLACEMIKGLVPRFESHHKLQFSLGAIPELVKLAKRYFTKKRLPASAIELLDISMSSAKLRNETSAFNLEKIEEQVSEAIDNQDKVELLSLYDRTLNLISHLLLDNLQEPFLLDGDAELAELGEAFTSKLSQLKELAVEEIEIVGEKEILSVASHVAKIPLGSIKEEEGKRLQELESHLRKRVVGQDHVLKEVADSLNRVRAITQGKNKPKGKFFFAGPTGTGKTELAKAIAQFLFGDEAAMLRFDMSEYMEKHAAEALVGAPPGFVGYEEGGRLVNSIRQKPYSVMLFDEIEKAHANVYKLFLPVLDDAQLKDRQGKKGDFSNSILIFTSNVCSDWIQERFAAGTPPGGKELRNKLKSLTDSRGEKIFAPEFIGRFDSVIPFAPISEKVAHLILDIQLSHFKERLKNQQLTFSLSQATKDFLIEQIFEAEDNESGKEEATTGNNDTKTRFSTFGARPIAYLIEEKLGTPIAEKIIAGELNPSDEIVMDWNPETEEIVCKVLHKQ